MNDTDTAANQKLDEKFVLKPISQQLIRSLATNYLLPFVSYPYTIFACLSPPLEYALIKER